MHLLIAPDSFKGTATAVEVAASLAAGWRGVRPDDTVDELPMADGGEGTLDAFAVASPGAARHAVTVDGPAGTPVDAFWLSLPDGRAVVELASTSGITLLDRLRPDDASTIGFGQAIAAALDAGATGLILAIGGSSSTDGGLGLLVALGARALDADGAALAPSGAALDALAELDLSALRPLPPEGVVVVTDVTSPLLGPDGAAAVFGPQKGVTPDRVAVHEGRLARLAALLPAVDATAAGAGAAGGSGFGLLAWGASLTPGAAATADALGLAARLEGADLVITGEGRYDGQSEAGKVPVHVARAAVAAGVPVSLVAGSIEADSTRFAGAVDLCTLPGGREAALGDTLAALRRAGAALASALG